MKTKNPTFPIIIAFQSILVLVKFFSRPTDIYGLISVIVGVTGIFYYYKENNKYDTFFYTWVYLQFPDIYFLTNSGVEIPLANAFNGLIFPLNFGVGMSLVLKGYNQLTIYLNLLPIALYYLLKYINVEKPLRKSITINRLRKGSFPQIQFPVTGIIEKLSGRKKMSGIYLINLDKEIQIKDKSYKYILLEPKDNSLIEVTDKKQICSLRLCDPPNVNYNNQQNTMVDWVTVECL